MVFALSVADRRYLVTGSTRGVGRAIAESLLENGAVVGIHGRDESRVGEICRVLDPSGERALPIAADFDSPERAGIAVAEFAEKAGGLDGLVNNAGAGKPLAFRGQTIEGWRQTMRANLEAAMIASREAYNLMRRRRVGCMVNVASIAAHGPGGWMGADYAAAKAGLVSLTKSLALEAARFGIRVNAVSPGLVETDMTADLPDEMRRDLGIPLARLGRPEEIGNAVVFLLSDLSSYMTGQVLHVDGGLWMQG